MSSVPGTPIAPSDPAGSLGEPARASRAIARVAAGLACASALYASAALADSRIPACGQLRAGAPRTDANLVLIVNDSLRRDRMSTYGGPARTPSFDAFAKANLLFRRAITQATWTKPSVASLFTSLLPVDHGLVDDPAWRPGKQGTIKADMLAERFTTLAEVLHGSGMRTAGFVANPWLDERFGFGQGFDLWDDSFNDWDTPAAEVNEAARTWLGTLPKDERFFVYVHFLDTHRPYGRLDPAEVADARAAIEADARPIPVRERTEIAFQSKLTNGKSIVAGGAKLTPTLVAMAYDRGVEDFDRALGALLATFEARPDWSRTAVIVTSDHGEALFERGWGNHGRSMHGDESAVPLAARLPGVRSEKPIDCPVGLVDVMPTVCDYLGIACPEGITGASMLARDSAERPPRFLIIEGIRGHPNHRAVVGERYKLMHEPDGRVRQRRRNPAESDLPPSLYDLREDPAETTDLLASEPRPPEVEAVRLEMIEALDAIARAPRRPAAPSAEIDPALAERLKSLGYLEGSPTPGEAPDAAPKDDD